MTSETSTKTPKSSTKSPSTSTKDHKTSTKIPPNSHQSTTIANNVKTTTKTGKTSEISTSTITLTSTSRNSSELTTTDEDSFHIVTKASTTESPSTTTVYRSTKVLNKPRPPRPWDCTAFKLNSLPSECCKLPKFKFPQETIDKCKKNCESTNSRHCCLVECKFSETFIYKDKQFHDMAILSLYKMILIEKSTDDDDVKLWMNATKLSINFCKNAENIFEKPTVNPRDLVDRDTTTTEKSKRNRRSNENTTISATVNGTTRKATTESLRNVQDRNLYCNVPIYVFMIISCTAVRNFVNCPHFDDYDVCSDWRNYLVKCGGGLKHQF